MRPAHTATYQQRFTPAPLALAAIMAITLIAGHSPYASAQTAASASTASPIAINISAQPLGQALNELARQANLQLTFPAALVANKQAQAVSGQLTLQQALQKLLAGTNLRATISDKQVIIQSPPPSDDVEAASLPTITVTGTRAATTSDTFITQTRSAKVGKNGGKTVQETPFSINVIDVEQIRETGAKSVQDALQYSAGVYAGPYGFDTRADWATVRGLTPSNYSDGLRGNFGYYNNARPEIYALETVEVLRGPSSALYGQADLGGIVNINSKLPKAETAREIELQLGSHQRKQIAADFTGSLNETQTLQYRVVALARDSNTQVDYVNDDARLLMPSLAWQPNTDTRITALYLRQANKSTVSSQFLPFKGTLGDAPLGKIPSNRFAGEPGWDRYDTKKDEWSLFWSQRLNSSWKLNSSLRKTDSSSVTREVWTTVGQVPDSLGNTSRTVHAADRNTDVLASDIRLEGTHTIGSTRHQLALGFDYQNALWEESNYIFAPGVGAFNVYNPVYGNVGALNLNALPLKDRPDNKIVQTGLYATDHLSWGRWEVSGALRHDTARNTQLKLTTPNSVANHSATTGRIGVMYQFDSGISPYVSYATAFLPNLGNDGTPGGGSLKPTTGNQKEIGLKYLSPSENTSAAFAWFDIEQQNRIVDGKTPGGREQLGATSRGWELEARHRIDGLEVLGNYTHMAALNAVTGTRLGQVAERTASTWATYRFNKGIRVGLGARHIGTVTGTQGAPEVPAVSLVDFMIGYAMNGWDLRFDVKNAADKQYISWCRGTNLDCGHGERLNAALTLRHRF